MLLLCWRPAASGKMHIEQAEKSTFIKNMVNEVKSDVGECTDWLKQMVSSITI
jgi:hypothetical protein